jgi:hypothetical protein
MRAKTGFDRPTNEHGVIGIASALGDPISEWKRAVLARLKEEQRAAPSTRLHVTLGFVGLTMLGGAVRGPVGSVCAVAVIGSVIFVHELPRASFALALGRSSRIRIDAAGGDTELSGAPLGPVASSAFTWIGSLGNIGVALLAFESARTGIPAAGAAVLKAFALSHAAWGAMQFVPLVPFRAGRVIAARLTPIARFAFTACSVVLAVGFIVANFVPEPLLLGFVAIVIAGSLRAIRDSYRESFEAQAGLDAVLRDVRAALSSSDCRRAGELARSGLARALSPARREKLWTALAWAGIGKGDPFLAHDALLRLPLRAIDLHLLASYLSCCNRVEEAVAVLEEARALGHRSPETSKLLADLLFRKGEHAAVLALSESDAALLTAEEREAIVTACS